MFQLPEDGRVSWAVFEAEAIEKQPDMIHMRWNGCWITMRGVVPTRKQHSVDKKWWGLEHYLFEEKEPEVSRAIHGRCYGYIGASRVDHKLFIV